MPQRDRTLDERIRSNEPERPTAQPRREPPPAGPPLVSALGNAAVQRLLRATQSEEEAPAADNAIAGAIEAERGGGQALDEDAAERFGRDFGADLSGVRVHEDSASDVLNKAVQAEAFTTGAGHLLPRGPVPARQHRGRSPARARADARRAARVVTRRERLRPRGERPAGCLGTRGGCGRPAAHRSRRRGRAAGRGGGGADDVSRPRSSGRRGRGADDVSRPRSSGRRGRGADDVSRPRSSGRRGRGADDVSRPSIVRSTRKRS